MGGQAVEPQGLAVDVQMAGRAVDIERLQVGVAAQDVPGHRGPVVVDPEVGAGERVEPASQVRLPAADQEVEVVGAVAAGRRRGELLLRRGRTGDQRRRQGEGLEPVECLVVHGFASVVRGG